MTWTVTFEWEYGNVREAKYTPPSRTPHGALLEAWKLAETQIQRPGDNAMPAPSRIVIEQEFVV